MASRTQSNGVADPESRPRQRDRRIPFFLLTLAILAVLLEGGARLASRYLQERSVRPAQLDDYKIPDPSDRSLWRLRPGYVRTVDEWIEEKRRAGKLLGVAHLESAKRRLGLSGKTVALRINRHGFRGPELREGEERTARWLALGDSCTFGTIEDFAYPRVLERALRRAAPVEIVNGAVEGYSPRHVLARIREYKRLRPDVTILYIGWNALFAERVSFEDRTPGRPADPAVRLESVRLARRAAASLVRGRHDAREEALAAYSRRKRPDRRDPALDLLRDWQPAFLENVERIVVEMRESGSTVVLVTLPGLYRTGDTPSPRALEIGHLPRFTDNPFVLATMAERYNEALRRLAGEHDLELVDLELWARRELVPPERYFFDSVHLWEEGQVRIGERLAEQLVHLLGAREDVVPERDTERPARRSRPVGLRDATSAP